MCTKKCICKVGPLGCWLSFNVISTPVEILKGSELMPDVIMETIRDFAKRVNLPEKLIRLMVRQGQLPHVKTNGNCHVRIHVEAALEAIKQYSIQTAEAIAATLPIPMRLYRMPPKSADERKYKGRPPDAVRLGKKVR